MDRESVDAALSAFGLVAEGVQEPELVPVWPENQEPFEVFTAMQTQWRVGPGGATGLDYAALPAVMVMMGVKRKRRADVMGAMQVIEREVLRLWAERRERERDK